MKHTLTITTPGDREIVISRVFDAPRALVWEAMARTDLLERWAPGPPGWALRVCEQELRPGGAFRFVWQSPDGAEMTMRGIYREVVPPGRVVRTESFAFGDAPASRETRTTLELVERDRRTTLTLTVVHASRQARDAAIESGMERGLAEGYDRLDPLLASPTTGFHGAQP
jgi:uncharacterized protein YndB with AHSA1/START domain